MISKELLSQLNQIYNKSTLEKALLPFVKKFLLPTLFEPREFPVADQNIRNLVQNKQLNASDTALLSFSVFDNEKIYKKFLASLPKSIQLLIEKLLWVESITDAEAELLLKEPVTAMGQYSMYSKELKKEFYFFSVSEPNRYAFTPNNIFVLYLHPVFKKVLQEYYPKPDYFYFIALDEIPETRYRFTAEKLITQEMPRLLSYYLQDGIKYSTKGKPVDATLNKLQRTIGIADFNQDERESFKNVRATLMAGLLYNFKLNNINIDTITLLKNLITKQYINLCTSQFLLTQIKGWAYMDRGDYNENAEHNILEVFKQLPPGKWVSAANFLDFIDYHLTPVKPATSWALSNRLYTENIIKTTHSGYLEKKYVGGQGDLLVKYPFIKGAIYLMSSCGLVEIAYDDINKEKLGVTFFSVYDGLKFLRLTNLGCYILGLSVTYESAEQQQQNKLNFSEDSLMILAEGEIGVLEVMLAKFAEKAGNNRFKVTHAHFLKDCKSRKDVDNKIALFKRTVSQILPPYWEQQFRIWRDNALKISPEVNLLVFKIPVDAKELQRLIAQDAVLKTLILKAEQFYILVPSKNITKFKSRMKELSYLVE